MSVAKTAQAVLRKIGVNIHPWPTERHLALDYRVSDRPRYGYKTAPHRALADMIEAKRLDMAQTVSEIAQRSDLIGQIPANAPAAPLGPYWNNGWFPPLDATVLMHLLLKRAPKRYTEIGSGNSTIFAHHAKTYGKLPTRITSIDPMPRAGIDTLCDEIIRRPLEDVDQSVFDTLEEGDVLFFDGSHRVFQDSDVTVFFLEVLPRLKPGTLVHVHDIFWPKDYPPEWGGRYYSEQYMLAMLLLHAPERYETVFASAYASEALATEVAALTPGDPVWGCYGTSYWFETR